MVGVVRNLRTTTWRTQQRNGLSLCFPEEVTQSWVLEDRPGRCSPLMKGWGIFLLDGRNREVGGEVGRQRKGGKGKGRTEEEKKGEQSSPGMWR